MSNHDKIRRAALAADLNERLDWLESGGSSEAKKRFGNSYKLPDWLRRAAARQVKAERNRLWTEALVGDELEQLAAPYLVPDRESVDSRFRREVRAAEKAQR